MQSVQIPGIAAVPPGFGIMRDRMLCERTQDDKAESHKQDIAENEFGDQCFFILYLKFVADSPDGCN